jgi:hypothetical protein
MLAPTISVLTLLGESIMSPRSAGRLAAMGTLVALISISGWAAETAPAAKEVGDSWEVTSQMSMEGMPMNMPAQTMKVCTAKEWKEPPVAADERRKCKNTDFKKDGAKITWKTFCESPDMTGDGEITRTGDTYAGTLKFTSGQGSMTTKLSGKRLGDCEIKK